MADQGAGRRRGERANLRRATFGAVAVAAGLNAVLFLQTGGAPDAPSAQEIVVEIARATLPGAGPRPPSVAPAPASPASNPAAGSHQS